MIEFFNRAIADFVLFTSQEISGFWQNIQLLNFSYPQVIIDILLVSVLFYFIFALLRGTRAVHILTGLTIITILFLLSKWLELIALGWLLDQFLTVTLVAIPVIFQQELRMGLETLGRTKLFHNVTAEQIEEIMLSILAACEQMKEKKIGALIVLQNETSLSAYAETGVNMNANVSKELLLNIFMPRSPLHDGAVLIQDGKIRAAACILPPSFKSYGHDYGTRHKAAIGLSEETDAQVIVISEEKGTLSYAKDGKLDKNITIEQLSRQLKRFYRKQIKETKTP